jgi:hypothetical protein
MYCFRYIRLLTNVLEWQKKHQPQVTINNSSVNKTNNVCNNGLEVQVKCEAPLCNSSLSNGTCPEGTIARLQQSIRCRHHLLMLKAPIVCDRNGNNLLTIEHASPFVSSPTQSNKVHTSSNQGNASVFPRPQIKVEKDEDTTKDDEDIRVGEDFVVQKPGSAADEKLCVTIAPRTSGLGRANGSSPHVAGGRRTPAKITRNIVPSAFVHQHMRNKKTRIHTGNVREVQCWASNFHAEKDKNLNKK